MKRFASLTTCLALLATPLPALAFKYRSCLGDPLKFLSNTETVHASTVSFPAGYWARGIQDTVDKFNNNPSKFRYVLDMKQGKVGRNNGQSEIWGSKGAILNKSPAIAYTYWTCYWFFGDHVHIDGPM